MSEKYTPLLEKRNERAIQDFIQHWQPDRKERATRLYRESFSDSISPLDALVAIPVDSVNERPEVLEHTLQQYCYQSARTRWELFFLLNRRTDTSTENEEQLLKVLRSFKEALPVRFGSLQYPSQVTMGRIRSDMMDVALLHEGKPRIVISHDADTVAMAYDYIDSVAEASNENPHAAVLSCQLNWSSGPYDTYPEEEKREADKILQLWSELVNISKKINNFRPSSDANSAVKLDSYAGVNGYNWEVDVHNASEFSELKGRILEADPTQQVYIIKDTWLASNDRRLRATITKGEPPFNSTSATNFDTHMDNFRKQYSQGTPPSRVSTQDMINTLYINYFEKLTYSNNREKVEKPNCMDSATFHSLMRALCQKNNLPYPSIAL